MIPEVREARGEVVARARAPACALGQAAQLLIHGCPRAHASSPAHPEDESKGEM